MDGCRIARQVAEWNLQGKMRRDRRGLGTACKEEISRMKNLSIESSGRNK
jgi:hypothetical protein